MELERNQVVFSELQKGEYKKLKDEGFIERGEKEHYLAPTVASFTVDGEEGVFDISMNRLVLGTL